MIARFPRRTTLWAMVVLASTLAFHPGNQSLAQATTETEIPPPVVERVELQRVKFALGGKLPCVIGRTNCELDRGLHQYDGLWLHNEDTPGNWPLIGVVVYGQDLAPGGRPPKVENLAQDVLFRGAVPFHPDGNALTLVFRLNPDAPPGPRVFKLNGTPITWVLEYSDRRATQAAPQMVTSLTFVRRQGERFVAVAEGHAYLGETLWVRSVFAAPGVDCKAREVTLETKDQTIALALSEEDPEGSPAGQTACLSVPIQLVKPEAP